MPLVLSDRVQEETTTTGTGAVTLTGAVSGYQSFNAGVGTGNTTYYTIQDMTNNAWEVGIGTYTHSTTSLSRTTVLASSNSGSLVNFGAGTKQVFVTYPAKRSAMTTGIHENKITIDTNYTISTDANAMSAGPITVASGVTVTVPSGSTWTVI
jgi:hypothetical protein